MPFKEDVIRSFSDTLWKNLEMAIEEYNLDPRDVRRKIFNPIVNAFKKRVMRTPVEKLTFDAAQVANEVYDEIDFTLEPEEIVGRALEVIDKYFPPEVLSEVKGEEVLDIYRQTSPELVREIEEKLKKSVEAKYRGKLSVKEKIIKRLTLEVKELRERLEEARRVAEAEALESLAEEVDALIKKFNIPPDIANEVKTKVDEAIVMFRQGRIDFAEAKRIIREARERILQEAARRAKPPEVKPKPPAPRVPFKCPTGEEPIVIRDLITWMRQITPKDIIAYASPGREEPPKYVSLVIHFFKDIKDVFRIVGNALGLSIEPPPVPERFYRVVVKGMPLEEALNIAGLPEVETLHTIASELERRLPRWKLTRIYYCPRAGMVYMVTEKYKAGKWVAEAKPAIKELKKEVEELFKPPRPAAPAVPVRRGIVMLPEKVVPKELEQAMAAKYTEWCDAEPMRRMVIGTTVVYFCTKSGRKVVGDLELYPLYGAEGSVFLLEKDESYDPVNHRVVKP